jgi:hypothetical protein
MSTSGDLTLTGQRFNLGSSIKVSLQNKITKAVTVLTPSDSNSTSITVTVSNLESGYYAVRARIDSLGESNSLDLTLNPSKDTLPQSSISVMGGQIIIPGWGFPSTWPNSYYNKLGLTTGSINIPLDFVSLSTTKIVLRIPRGINSKSYTFKLISPTGVTITASFSQSNTNTPTVDLTSTGTIAPNTLSTISLNRTVKSTTTP